MPSLTVFLLMLVVGASATSCGTLRMTTHTGKRNWDLSASHNHFCDPMVAEQGDDFDAPPVEREGTYDSIPLDPAAKPRKRTGPLAQEPLLDRPATPVLRRPAATSATGDGAVVLMYHHFGEERRLRPSPASTNIRIEQFESHLDTLAKGGFRVLPLIEIVRTLKTGGQLPTNAIALTTDDSYASIYFEGFPRWRNAKFPATVFVNTGAIDRRFGGALTWDHLREMVKSGVDVGCHTTEHHHMTDPRVDNARNARDLINCVTRIKQELKLTPKLFAYPFGEFSQGVRELVASFGPALVKQYEPELIEKHGEEFFADFGFEAAFGQHSGAVHARADFYSLPRFSLNERYGEPERFEPRLSALPLPVSDFEPLEPVLPVNASGKTLFPKDITFQVPDHIGPLNRLQCFVWDEPATIRIAGRVVTVNVQKPFAYRRGRINCTMPHQGRFRWFGVQYIDVTKPEGY